MKEFRKIVLPLGCALAVACGSPAEARSQVAADQDLAATNEPYLYTSEQGDFQVVMPGGCAQVRQRTNDPQAAGLAGDGEQGVQVLNVMCDRGGRPGSGCAVSSYLNVTDGKGGPATEAQMTPMVQRYLERFGVDVVKQSQVARDFPGGRHARGVDLRCRAPESPGEFWVRGLVVDGDIYILAAWNDDGGLWNDPDIVNFFDSFVPSAS